MQKENFKNRLLHFEEMPPASVWNNIKNRLDEADEAIYIDKVKNKLQSIEVIPPITNWATIEKNLPAKVISLPANNKVHLLKRLTAVAAVLVIAILTGIIIYNNSNNTDADASIAVVKVPATAPTISSADADNSNIITPVIQDVNTNNNILPNAGKNTDTRNLLAVNTAAGLRAASAKWENHTPIACDKYTTINAKGTAQVRVSNKIGDMVHCVTGVSHNDVCKEQYEMMQNQIAQIPAVTGNFLDLVNMVSSLQECNGL